LFESLCHYEKDQEELKICYLYEGTLGVVADVTIELQQFFSVPQISSLYLYLQDKGYRYMGEGLEVGNALGGSARWERILLCGWGTHAVHRWDNKVPAPLAPNQPAPDSALLSQVPDCLWAKDEYDIGKMRGATPVTVSPKGTY
jgi:hypothetical protein